MSERSPGLEYARLRDAGAVQRRVGPDGKETWLLTRYADVRAALRDPRLSCRRPQGRGPGLGANLLSTDPPDHTRLRQAVGAAFTPRRIEALRPRVQEIADELLDGIAGQDECDLIETFAYPLPITVIGELLGIPVGARPEFRRWTRELGRPGEGGPGRMRDYVAGTVSERRAALRAGVAGDQQPDLVSALVANAAGTGDISDEELLAMVMLLIVAGHETTVRLIAKGMAALFQHPAQLRLLRERPELVPGAVEELLRYDGPAPQTTPRLATEDVEIAGVTIPAGSSVTGILACADHDPEQFPDPARLDVARQPTQHLAFGHGIHFCLGAPLARMEGAVAFETLLRRFPDLAPAYPPGELEWRADGPLSRTPERLPVRPTAR